VKRGCLTSVGGLLLVALAAMYLLWWGPGPRRGPHDIVVPEGSTLASVSRQLAKQGAIPGTAKTYYAMSRIFGSHDPIQAGEFQIPRGMGGAAILNLLQHGRPVQRLVTVLPGMPAIVLSEKLNATAFLTGPVPDIAEGSVLPDSYGYQRDETRAALVKRMQSAMTRTLAAEWGKRDYVCPLATKEQALILASIVEKETAKASERPIVAGVYCNRLRINMPLQADPTVIYPVTKGKPLGRRILKSELRADNGYNTYRRTGLPEGPIANPGAAAIKAVLHPAKTKALYFVADGTGGHAFAQTLAEQNANVAKWYAIRRARGEM
jgi:UPF0755 protein